MTWPEFGTGTAPALPLRELILSACAGMAISLRDGTGHCAGCGAGTPCPDHQAALALAGAYEAAYTQVATGSSQCRGLAVTLASGAN